MSALTLCGELRKSGGFCGKSSEKCAGNVDDFASNRSDDAAQAAAPTALRGITDLDRLKTIHDDFGHTIGDQVPHQVFAYADGKSRSPLAVDRHE
jgi:hypothetical protein